MLLVSGPSQQGAAPGGAAAWAAGAWQGSAGRAAIPACTALAGVNNEHREGHLAHTYSETHSL